MFDVYLITGAHRASEIVAKAERALWNVARARVALQLRAKHLTVADRNAIALTLRALTAERGVALLVNGELDLAVSVGADGVQLPEAGPSVETARRVLGDGALIGASRHAEDGVHAAAQAGASFVTLSPVFGVPEKDAPLGISAFATIARKSTLPVFALGGVSAATTGELVRRGAHGVAVVREIWEARDPATSLRALLEAVDAGRSKREMS